MRWYRLFLLALFVGFAAACHSPVSPRDPEDEPKPPDPSEGFAVTQQQVWVRV